MFHFHYAYGFVAQSLAHMLDSLVRVSRRVDGSHFVSIPRRRVSRAASGGPRREAQQAVPPAWAPRAALIQPRAPPLFSSMDGRGTRGGVNAGRALEGPDRLPRHRQSPPPPMDADRSRPKCSRPGAPGARSGRPKPLRTARRRPPGGLIRPGARTGSDRFPFNNFKHF